MDIDFDILNDTSRRMHALVVELFAAEDALAEIPLDAAASPDAKAAAARVVVAKQALRRGMLTYETVVLPQAG